ncbi:MAG: hypothetical protein ACREXO_13660 [Advenella sp.]
MRFKKMTGRQLLLADIGFISSTSMSALAVVELRAVEQAAGKGPGWR